MRFKQFYLKESLETFQNELKEKYGLTHLRLEMKGSDLLLDMIVVPKDKRKVGVGSKVLEEITHYADTNNLRLLLTTAVKDDYHGTTSSERLKKFYKKFGFVENKGRNKDFTTRHNMIRVPKKVYKFDKIEESEDQNIEYGLWSGWNILFKNGKTLPTTSGIKGTVGVKIVQDGDKFKIYHSDISVNDFRDGFNRSYPPNEKYQGVEIKIA